MEDDTAAISWYTRAAEQGDADAQNNLGAMYDAGEGVEENNGEAVKWYTLAANQGNTIAQNNLGAMFYSGEGAATDKVEAYKWFYISENLGNEDGKNNRVASSDDMVLGDIVEAKSLARQWLDDYKSSKSDL